MGTVTDLHSGGSEAYAGDKQRRPRSWHPMVRSLCALGLAVLLFTALAPSRLLQELWQPCSHCVLIDAGSSGTRVHVFRFVPRRGGTPRVLSPPSVLKLEPGLSSFVEAPERAAEQLGALLAFAKAQVPAGRVPSTPVVLLATAGLRLLHPSEAEALLQACRPTLTASAFLFRHEWAHVLEGAQEGAFAWVAANYASGTLTGDPRNTVGVLELGGASAQVTFVPDVTPPQEHRLDVHISAGGGGSVSSTTAAPRVLRYTLYTHSFLGLGLDAAAQGLAVTSATSQQACSSFEACRASAARAMHLGSVPCAHARCVGADSAYAPPLVGRFLALENFAHTARRLGLPPHATLAQLGAAGAAACQAAVDDVTEDERLCFAAAYVFAFLHDGFGVALQDASTLRFSDSAGDSHTPVDWALGALVAQYAALAPPPPLWSHHRVLALMALTAALLPALTWAHGAREELGVSNAAGFKRSVSNLGL